MAIGFDAAANGGVVNPGTSLTWSHTCTGSELLLRVGVRGDTGGSDLVSGVTYNGVALSKIGSSYIGSHDRWISLWELKDPDTGTHDVVVSSSSAVIIAASASYTGADTYDASATASDGPAVNTLTASVTPLADNCWVMGVYGNSFGDSSASTGATERVSNGSGLGLYDNGAAISPAASTSMIVTTGGAASMAAIVASIRPRTGGGGGGTGGRNLTTLGVGAALTYGPAYWRWKRQQAIRDARIQRIGRQIARRDA